MVSDKYSFRFSVFYPLIVFFLNVLLLIMGIYALNHYFNLLELNLFSILLISIFLLESLIRCNAGQKLDLPKFIFVLEAGLYLLILSFFTPGFYNIRIWIIWGLSLICWSNIYGLSSLFRLFETNCDKVYGKNNSDSKGNGSKWTFDEFRRLLDYPTHWKKIVGTVYFSNIPLVLIWVIIHETNVLLFTGSIIYLALELFLLGSLYLEKKTLDWYIEGLERPPFLKKVWSVFLILFLLITVTTSAILPYRYNPLPLESIGKWFNSLSRGLRVEEMPSREQAPVEQPSFDFEEREENESSLFFKIVLLLLQLLLSTVLIIIILGIIIFILRQEYHKLGNLPAFFKNYLRYLYNLIKGLFSRVKGAVFNLNSFREVFSREGSVKKGSRKEINEMKNIQLPGELKPLIIKIYHSMLKLLALKGERKKKTETPYEYSQMVIEKHKNTRKEIAGITRLYVEIIYSNHKIQNKVKKMVRQLWESLYNKF